MSREEKAESKESLVLPNAGREEALDADRTRTMIADSQLSNDFRDLNNEVCCANHSVANAAREDSSVKVRSATT